jgi:sulfite reductase (ferredoxin)
MVHAAQGLVKIQNADISDDQETILAEFRQRFCDTQVFYDKYAGSKFADFLFIAKESLHGNGGNGHTTRDLARQRIEEAQLFIDAAHSCFGRLQGGRATP